jgi:hypothetical protein
VDGISLIKRNEVNVWSNYDSFSSYSFLQCLWVIRILLCLFVFQQQALAGSLVAGASSAMEADPFKRQQAMPPTGMSRAQAGAASTAVAV